MFLKRFMAAVAMTAAMAAAHATPDCVLNSPGISIGGVNTSALSVSQPLINGNSFAPGLAYKAATTLTISCGSPASAWSLAAPAGFVALTGAVNSSWIVLIDPVTTKPVCDACANGAAMTGTGSASINLEVWCSGASTKCLESTTGFVTGSITTTLTSPGGTSSGSVTFSGSRAYTCSVNSPTFNIGAHGFEAESVNDLASVSHSTRVYKTPVALAVTCDAAVVVSISGPATVLVTVGSTANAGEALLYRASNKQPLVALTPLNDQSANGSKSFTDLEVWLSGSQAGKVFGNGATGPFSAVLPITVVY